MQGYKENEWENPLGRFWIYDSNLNRLIFSSRLLEALGISNTEQSLEFDFSDELLKHFDHDGRSLLTSLILSLKAKQNPSKTLLRYADNLVYQVKIEALAGHENTWKAWHEPIKIQVIEEEIAEESFEIIGHPTLGLLKIDLKEAVFTLCSQAYDLLHLPLKARIDIPTFLGLFKPGKGLDLLKKWLATPDKSSDKLIVELALDQELTRWIQLCLWKSKFKHH